MKMFLTRFGMRSRMVICGDPHQVDLPDPSKSGLADAVDSSKASRALRWSASPPPTSSAIRSSGASSKPMKGRDAR